MSRITRRRRKSATSSAEKWKNKLWVDVRAPLYVDDKSLGKTPTTSLDTVVGRTIKISLMDLTGNFKDLNYHLNFKISELEGNLARTEFFQYELSRDFKRAQIRNHRSKIEGIFNFNLQDNAKIRLTAFVVTPKRAAASIKKEVRAEMQKMLEERLKETTFPAFVEELLNGNLVRELFPVAADIFPVKVIEVAKVKVLRLPQDE